MIYLTLHSKLQRLVEECALCQREEVCTMTNPVIENIRRSPGRTAQTPIGLRPAIFESLQAESLESEAERFLDEIKKLSAVGQQLPSTEIDSALKVLVTEQNVPGFKDVSNAGQNLRLQC